MNLLCQKISKDVKFKRRSMSLSQQETVLCVCSASSTSPVCNPFQSAERDGTALTCLVRDRFAL
ncbi:hypothetical protein T08_6732 [Trichinella sp. T8]|nr:hypothetical protein T08_6732 [Trichinella sp. T8]